MKFQEWVLKFQVEIRNEIRNIQSQEVIIMNENKTNINCLITIYLTPSTNPYFIRNYENLDNAYFTKKTLKNSEKQQKCAAF